MTFEEYLVGKKIDTEAFKNAEPGLWNDFKSIFDKMHPNSFTSQKLYLINPIRRKYPLPLEMKGAGLKEVLPGTPVKPGRPVVKPKIN